MIDGFVNLEFVHTSDHLIDGTESELRHDLPLVTS